jgi:excisionase family DNA binding protein
MAIDLRNIDPELSYSFKEVAAFLNVSYGTVLKLKSDPKLDLIRIGKKYYIRGKDILGYIKRK